MSKPNVSTAPQEIKDRIRKIRKENHLSQVEFAQKLNVSQSVISLIESGNASVSIEIIKRLSTEFDLSCDWLIYGKDRYTRLSVQNSFIPLVSIEAEAGYISSYNDPDYAHSLDLYRLPGYENGEYRIFMVEGDSMIPSIHPHDKVVCEKIDNPASVVEGTLNVVISKSNIVVKRIYFWEQDRNMIVLKSDNQHYTEERLPLSEVKQMWAVRAKLTSSFIDQSYAQNERMDMLEKELQVIKDQVVELNSRTSSMPSQPGSLGMNGHSDNKEKKKA